MTGLLIFMSLGKCLHLGKCLPLRQLQVFCLFFICLSTRISEVKQFKKKSFNQVISCTNRSALTWV